MIVAAWLRDPLVSGWHPPTNHEPPIVFVRVGAATSGVRGIELVDGCIRVEYAASHPVLVPLVHVYGLVESE